MLVSGKVQFICKQVLAIYLCLVLCLLIKLCFPLHIVPTDLRPDLVWWDDKHRSLTMAELTVCFETNFEQEYDWHDL